MPLETAIDALIGMSGEMGELVKELKEKGWDWIQATIEICRESKALTIIFGNLSTMVMMIPPTLWVEGFSTAAGYIIPEIIVTLILILITYISAGAGGTVIAARIAGYVAKIRDFLKNIGHLGKVFNVLFDLVAKLKDDIAKLIKALYQRIAEKVDGAVDRVNKIVRRNKKPDSKDVTNSKVFKGVKSDMYAKDVADGIVRNGVYPRNKLTFNLKDQVSSNGQVLEMGSAKGIHGERMFVIDKDGNFLIGKRDPSGEMRMPHPTLVGGKDPEVLAAGMIQFSKGRILNVNNASGHFKLHANTLNTAEDILRNLLPSNSFSPKFKGFNPIEGSY